MDHLCVVYHNLCSTHGIELCRLNTINLIPCICSAMGCIMGKLCPDHLHNTDTYVVTTGTYISVSAAI
jgi:hypothetical protein